MNDYFSPPGIHKQPSEKRCGAMVPECLPHICICMIGYDRNPHFSHRSKRKCSYVLVQTSTRPTPNLIDWTWRRCERGWICSYLIGDEDFIFGKKVIPFFGARAAAPVATTTLGLRGCTRARPKEVVVWYTNGVHKYPSLICWNRVVLKDVWRARTQCSLVR